MKRVLSLLVVFSYVSALVGQPLTLDGCRNMALRNQAALREARIDVQQAKETRAAALTKFFPDVSLSAVAFRSQNYLIDYETSTNGNEAFEVNVTFDGQDLNDRIATLQGYIDMSGYDVDLQQTIDDFAGRFNADAHIRLLDRGYFGGALALWPIFAGGRIVNGNRLAKLGVDVACLQLQMTEKEVLANVEHSYWLVASLYEKRKSLDQAMALIDTLRRDAEAATAAGVIGKNDLLKMKLKSDEFAANSVTLDNAISLATMALCQYIGVEYSDSVYIADSLSGDLPPLPIASFDVSRRIEDSLLVLSAKAAKLQQLMTVGEALPQLSVGATYGISNLFDDRVKANGILFATLNVPITGLFENDRNVQKQRLERLKTEIKNEDLRQKMRLQMQQAWNELTEAYALINVRRQAVSDAEENLAEVGNYYAAGLASVSEYLEAQTLLRQARNDLADQIITYRLRHLAYCQMQ